MAGRGHVPVEAVPGFLFVEQPDKPARQPHEEQDDRGEHVDFALRLRGHIDEEGECGQCKQERRERVEE